MLWEHAMQSGNSQMLHACILQNAGVAGGRSNSCHSCRDRRSLPRVLLRSLRHCDLSILESIGPQACYRVIQSSVSAGCDPSRPEAY